METEKIRNPQLELLGFEIPVYNVLIWTFTLLVIGQFIAFLAGSYNLVIVGVCLVTMSILCLHSLLFAISKFSNHLDNANINTEEKRVMGELIIPGLTLIVSCLCIVSADFFGSLGIIFFTFRPFLACLLILLFVIQAFSIFSVQNFFISAKKGSNDSRKRHNQKLFPIAIFFTSSGIVMFFSVITTTLLTVTDLHWLLVDTLIKSILLPFFYVPMALMYLFITERVSIGSLKE